MKSCIRSITWLLAALLATSSIPIEAYAKSYSSGSKSYSSSSSRSSSSKSSSSRNSSSKSSNSSSRSSNRSSSSSKSSSSKSSGSKPSSSKPSSSSSSKSGSSSRSGDSSSSSKSKSSGPTRSSDSSSSSSGSKSFSSSNRKSYSSRSTDSDDDQRSYSSGKSYSAGSGQKFSSASSTSRRPQKSNRADPTSTSSGVTFDTAAARASKEQASKQEYQRFKETEASRPQPASDAGPALASSPVPAAGETEVYRGPVPPPLPSAPRVDSQREYVPDEQTMVSRAWREEERFRGYYSRPVVVYRDRYHNYFWWWLLDRSLEDRARWAYHHRPVMDPARYEALVASDAQLEERVAQLEAEQPARDPGYVPAGIERDLMYSEHYVATAYQNRPTRTGAIAFWLIGIPTAIALCGFFVWLIWFKRWQTQN